MKVNFIAGERHFAEHLRPVYNALPEDLRGEFVEGKVFYRNHAELTVVSSWGDYKRTTGPVIHFEHGCGLTYGNGHSSYAGGLGKDRVELFCVTNQAVADANAEVYPNTPQVIVGAPKLDAWANRPAPSYSLDTHLRYRNPPAVAFSFHWDCRVVPETRWAVPEYLGTVCEIARRKRLPYDMIGHGHPRAWSELSKVWARNGLRTMPRFDDVLAAANVYVCDNSSTIYEFAALDRPVVVLNASYYRRDVHHGLRFWEDVPGIQVNKASELQDAIQEAVENDTFAAERRRITEKVYPYLGQSAARSAQAIEALVRPSSSR
jgi:hypothetical protein